MNREQILDAVAELARRHLGFDGARSLSGSERLVEDLGLDSLKLQILAAEVENEFEIAFAPEEEAAITTTGELAGAVAAKLQVKLAARAPVREPA